MTQVEGDGRDYIGIHNISGVYSTGNYKERFVVGRMIGDGQRRFLKDKSFELHLEECS